MNKRTMTERVSWLGAVDWDRRLFDALIPLPDGTSYNAYLLKGSEATVLLDTVDPPMAPVLMKQLESVGRIDYIVSHHAEQDHSGTIPIVLERYPEAKVVVTPKAKGMLMDLLKLEDERFKVVKDGERLSLGDRTLQFLHTPWVHWPETMVSYLEEERILFSCDFFGSHLATSNLYVVDEARVYEAAKRYYAEIMMPFAAIITKNLEKLQPLEIDVIAPSHGPVYDRPAFIVDAYKEWVTAPPRNKVVLPFVSMHGSTRTMVDRLTEALMERGVTVERFDLAVADIGKIAMALVDAGTIVLGTPTVLTGPHPLAAYATVLTNALKPKARFLSVIGSYGWGGKAVETLASMIPRLKVEVLAPVLIKGLPRPEDLDKMDALAETVAAKHREAGFEKP